MTPGITNFNPLETENGQKSGNVLRVRNTKIVREMDFIIGMETGKMF